MYHSNIRSAYCNLPSSLHNRKKLPSAAHAHRCDSRRGSFSPLYDRKKLPSKPHLRFSNTRRMAFWTTRRQRAPLAGGGTGSTGSGTSGWRGITGRARVLLSAHCRGLALPATSRSGYGGVPPSSLEGSEDCPWGGVSMVLGATTTNGNCINRRFSMPPANLNSPAAPNYVLHPHSNPRCRWGAAAPPT